MKNLYILITSITILSMGSPSIDTSTNTQGFFLLISPCFKNDKQKRMHKHIAYIIQQKRPQIILLLYLILDFQMSRGKKKSGQRESPGGQRILLQRSHKKINCSGSKKYQHETFVLSLWPLNLTSNKHQSQKIVFALNSLESQTTKHHSRGDPHGIDNCTK